MGRRQATPQTFFVDRRGRIVDHVLGPVTDAALAAGVRAAPCRHEDASPCASARRSPSRAPALAASRPSEADLETKLVCPVCHETLDQSTAPVAQQMKAEIRRRIAQGWSEQQILDEMVANYGRGVLSTPATHGFDLLAWVLPIGGIARRRRRARRPAPGTGRGGRPGEPATSRTLRLAPEDEARLDAELARFDA